MCGSTFRNVQLTLRGCSASSIPEQRQDYKPDKASKKLRGDLDCEREVALCDVELLHVTRQLRHEAVCLSCARGDRGELRLDCKRVWIQDKRGSRAKRSRMSATARGSLDLRLTWSERDACGGRR